MIKIGEWLDFLKENDLYDNTRIIIAAVRILTQTNILSQMNS